MSTFFMFRIKNVNIEKRRWTLNGQNCVYVVIEWYLLHIFLELGDLSAFYLDITGQNGQNGLNKYNFCTIRNESFHLLLSQVKYIGFQFIEIKNLYEVQFHAALVFGFYSAFIRLFI